MRKLEDTDFTKEIFFLNYVVSWYMHKYYLIYTHKESMDFRTPIIMGLTN